MFLRFCVSRWCMFWCYESTSLAASDHHPAQQFLSWTFLLWFGNRPSEIRQRSVRDPSKICQYSVSGPLVVCQRSVRWSVKGSSEIRQSSVRGPSEICQWSVSGPSEVRQTTVCGPSEVRQRSVSSLSEVLIKSVFFLLSFCVCSRKSCRSLCCKMVIFVRVGPDSSSLLIHQCYFFPGASPDWTVISGQSAAEM